MFGELKATLSSSQSSNSQSSNSRSSNSRSSGAPSAASGVPLIGGVFAVDVSQPRPRSGGGLQAFVAVDRKSGRDDFMAVQVRPDAPARALALNMLISNVMDSVLLPLAHGRSLDAQGLPAHFVICSTPPGPPLIERALMERGGAPLRPWSEGDLLDLVLRPAAQALDRLSTRNVTHRAVRPDNMFRAANSDPVVLGCAWAAPPAAMQPAIFEPPYIAMCLPAGRGDGRVADDVYALAVTLITLALGRVPMLGMSDAEVIRRKLDLGSFAALVGDDRLPPAIADLARGMLAEDPEHRPLPSMLTDPGAARTRRVAARPQRRAQRPLEIGGHSAWTARMLGYAMATAPDEGARLLRNGAGERWVRRSLGDGFLASRLEEAVRMRAHDSEGDEQNSDALMLARAIAALDPLAPLCWNGTVLWPDGLGPVLAAADVAGDDGLAGNLEQMILHEAAGSWAAARPERCDPGTIRLEAHQFRGALRQRGWGGGLPRLRYALNPLLACRSPLLAAFLVVRPVDLLAALEVVAEQAENRKRVPIDREIAALLAARGDPSAEHELAALDDGRTADQAALIQLRLLAGLQSRGNGRSLPALAVWLGDQAEPGLAVWRHRDRRRQRTRDFAAASVAGQLDAMLRILDDPSARAEDARDLDLALAAVHEIDAELMHISGSGAARMSAARRIGYELAGSVGAMAVTVAAVAAVMI